jgi:hypothetical protein
MGETRNAYRCLVGNAKTKVPLGRIGVKGRIISKWISN